MEPDLFLKCYEAALATHDWQAVSPLIHENTFVTFSSGQTFRGKTAVQDAFENNFAQIQGEKYAISDIYWVEKSAELAVCTFTFQWSGWVNRKLVCGSGRGTSIFIREDGRWFLLSEHLGPNAE